MTASENTIKDNLNNSNYKLRKTTKLNDDVCNELNKNINDVCNELNKSINDTNKIVTKTEKFDITELNCLANNELKITEYSPFDHAIEDNNKNNSNVTKILGQLLTILKEQSQFMLYNAFEEIIEPEIYENVLYLKTKHEATYILINSKKALINDILININADLSVNIAKYDNKYTEKDNNMTKLLKDKFQDKLKII